MPGIIDKMAAKMSDHPNSTSNDRIKPTSGTQDVNNGDDPGKTDIQNQIKKGQGVGGLSGKAEPDPRRKSYERGYREYGNRHIGEDGIIEAR
jgi:hypothetical protein